MAIFKSARNGNLSKGIKYADKDRRVEDDFNLCRGINCSNFAEVALKQMRVTKAMFNKKGGREYQHYILAFAPGEISKENAIEYATEHAQRCFGERFQVFVGLHVNSKSGVLHAHYIVNSVSYIDGRKIHTSPEDYDIFKAKNDELAQEYGLQVIDRSPEAIEERGRKQLYSMESYQLFKTVEKDNRKESYTLNCFNCVESCLIKNPQSLLNFSNDMYTQGWEVKFRGKNITFQSLENPKHKVRANTLTKRYNNDAVSTAGILFNCRESGWKDYLIVSKQRQRVKQVEKVQPKTRSCGITSGLDTLVRMTNHQQQPYAHRNKMNVRLSSNEHNDYDGMGI